MSDRSPHPASKKRRHPDEDDPPERYKTPENTAPPPEQQRSTKETPAKPRSAHSSSFWDGGLAQKRIALLEDLGYAIPEVETDTFLNIFFPPLKTGISVDSIRASLERDGDIKANGQPTADRKVPKSTGHAEDAEASNKRWTAIPKDPKSSKEGENTVFLPFERIFNKVVEQALQSSDGLEQTFALRLLPNTAPESERESLTRPDGCFILKEIEKSSGNPNDIEYRWYDIALTCEFKKHDNEAQQDDNVTKIVYSMQHTMTLDLCKRFTFGITIENTSARLWFCSRAIMAVSRPFNFNKEPDLLIRVFLSLAFATKTELGWDPTIHVVDPKATKRVYEFDVNGKSYQVVDVLSDFGADAIIGRATRVFRVQLVGSNKFFVLKDVWVEDDRDLEHETYEKILNDVGNAYNELKKKEVASYLLTPVDHCLVEIDGQVDHTRAVMMRGRDVSFRNSFRLQAQDFGNKDSVKSKAPSKSTDREVREELNVHLGSRMLPKEKRPLRHRRHYRVIFGEVAQPIWTLTKLSDVFLVLRDSAYALKYIHGAGWIHRDISAGNIYFFNVNEQEARGLIGDLEYAKKVTMDGSHQMRTGTPDFMAVEVLLGAYLFDLPPEDSEDTDLTWISRFAEEGGRLAGNPSSETPFVQNEGHDVESLWWIANYILFFNRQSGVEETSSQQETRMEYMQTIFPSSGEFRERLKFLKNAKEYKEGTSWFSDSFLQLRVGLNALRKYLVRRYWEFERMLPAFNRDAFSNIQDAAIGVFKGCILIAEGITITSFKASGKKGQDELSPSSGLAPTEPPSTDASEGRKVTSLPRPPRKKLALRHP